VAIGRHRAVVGKRRGQGERLLQVFEWMLR
jgi:hypothetical protein